MSFRVKLKHSTRYTYDNLVTLSPQLVRLRPAPHCRTEIESYTLNIKPSEHLIHWQQDPFNNYVARIIFSNAIQEMSLDVEIIANLSPINPFDFYTEDYASQWPFEYTAEQKLDLSPYLTAQETGPEIAQFLASLPSASTEIIHFLLTVNQQILNRIGYIERLESGVQHSNDSLTKGTGSCRDSAWLLVQVFRHLGLAARFVSGYSILLASDTTSVQQDTTDLHAWTEVYIPGAGWIGLDPTSGLLAAEGYIPLCCTRTPESAAPISGIMQACKTTLFFENTVTRLP